MAPLRAADLAVACIINDQPLHLESVGDDLVVVSRADLEKVFSLLTGRSWSIEPGGASQTEPTGA